MLDAKERKQIRKLEGDFIKLLVSLPNTSRNDKQELRMVETATREHLSIALSHVRLALMFDKVQIDMGTV